MQTITPNNIKKTFFIFPIYYFIFCGKGTKIFLINYIYDEKNHFEQKNSQFSLIECAYFCHRSRCFIQDFLTEGWGSFLTCNQAITSWNLLRILELIEISQHSHGILRTRASLLFVFLNVFLIFFC